MEDKPQREALRQDFLAELENLASDPVHKRLIGAYSGDDPVRAMEQELASILREVLANED